MRHDAWSSSREAAAEDIDRQRAIPFSPMPEVAVLSPYLVGGVTVLGIVGYWLWARRNAAGSGHDPRYYADRQDPQRYWVQAVYAVYRGDVGDPAYWDPEDARREIQQGWSTPDREQLLALIQRYVAGECTPAFDHVRIIWLARLGAGAGWLDEATSWGYALQSKAMLQYGYTGWPALVAGLEQGRAQWYGGEDQVPPGERERREEHHRFAQQHFLPFCPFR